MDEPIEQLAVLYGAAHDDLREFMVLESLEPPPADVAALAHPASVEAQIEATRACLGTLATDTGTAVPEDVSDLSVYDLGDYIKGIMLAAWWEEEGWVEVPEPTHRARLIGFIEAKLGAPLPAVRARA